jgi:hypothetical protein
MQFTKPMIDLVYEIRKHVHSDLKPQVKLANPELMPLLIDSYQESSCDTITKALIKELMSLAGEDWMARIMAPSDNAGKTSAPKRSMFSYRGLVRHEDGPNDSTSSVKSAKPVRIYRGRVVA